MAIQLWFYAFFVPVVIYLIHSEGEDFFLTSQLWEQLVRLPYQWDFEIFFASIYIVWGIFLWQSKTREFQGFTAWAYLAHATSMLLVGYFKQEDFLHLFVDSLWWFIPGGLLLYLHKKKFD